MFAVACDRGRMFTRPVVSVYHCVDGQCRSGVGSFVIVNHDGWFLSASHIHTSIEEGINSVATTRAQKARIDAVVANHGLSKGQRKAALKEIGELAPAAPLDSAVWWGRDGLKAVDVCFLPDADLMLGRLDPFEPSWVLEYPTFKDPTTSIRQGTSLCRLGYPFPLLKTTYDADKMAFKLLPVELAAFPIEGILTRQVHVSLNAAGYRNMLLETSSPGLMGQSGGPILDTAGVVWGIQSSTAHLSLGFDPPVPSADGKSSHRREHQFLNVGRAAHPESVVGLLRERGIHHTLAS